MNYDDWLWQQAEEYNSECKPKVVHVHYEPCGDDIESVPEYNCEFCTDFECDQWLRFHDTEELEILKGLDQ